MKSEDKRKDIQFRGLIETQKDRIKELLQKTQQLESLCDKMNEALERIEGMAERPVCICGVQTGTAAIKACAEQAIKAYNEFKEK